MPFSQQAVYSQYVVTVYFWCGVFCLIAPLCHQGLALLRLQLTSLLGLTSLWRRQAEWRSSLRTEPNSRGGRLLPKSSASTWSNTEATCVTWWDWFLGLNTDVNICRQLYRPDVVPAVIHCLRDYCTSTRPRYSQPLLFCGRVSRNVKLTALKTTKMVIKPTNYKQKQMNNEKDQLQFHQQLRLQHSVSH